MFLGLIYTLEDSFIVILTICIHNVCLFVCLFVKTKKTNTKLNTIIFYTDSLQQLVKINKYKLNISTITSF